VIKPFNVNDDSLVRASNDSLSFSELIVCLLNDSPHSSPRERCSTHLSPVHESHKRIQRTNERSRLAREVRDVLEWLARSSRSPEQWDSRTKWLVWTILRERLWTNLSELGRDSELVGPITMKQDFYTCRCFHRSKFVALCMCSLMLLRWQNKGKKRGANITN
jgi:hypothetical protein